MPDIFVNYRTGDEEGAATLVERELSRRFGNERVFRASKSIDPGHRFPQELITAVRRSSVLLAVIGPRWAEARSADGRRALDDPADWTRREILEAMESGALVIPVLVNKATRLDRRALPAEMQELADYQYRRLDFRDTEADLSGLADELADLVPQLGAADTARKTESDQQQAADRPGDRRGEFRGTSLQAREVKQRQRGGIGNLNGDFSGTFISDPQAPVHTGDGDQYNAPRFSGDNTGVNYTGGDNSSTVHQRFERRRRAAEEGE
ncbi:toll/interleukin-1 receptor domain-containing protein [Streptomyces sp. NPDC087850]|uniref:toll/interleukin-1 receptor domain-containing protein n=1 Tax=Streptomyces sp. NPDC087850 TaxID=3365809 RepID=UPI00381F26FF